MPKKAKRIWPAIVSYENMHEAFRKVRKGKKFNSNVLRFYYGLTDNLFRLAESLDNYSWRPGPYNEFWIEEIKPRHISAPHVVDRIVHWALMLQAAPYFERRFIADSYACREDMGSHRASARALAFMREASAKWGKPFIFKADISKYFPSIDQQILMRRVERVIGDDHALWLFDSIIRNNRPDYGVGLPIGALTSQWLANLYLDALDHFIKDDLGIKYYIRYMDDFVVIGPSKEWCKTVWGIVDSFVTTLRLKLNPKTGIWPISQGLDFVGYRHWTDHVLPRKRTVKRARKQFRTLKKQYAKGMIDTEYIRPRVASFTGYMSHCDGWVTLEKILEGFVLKRE